jgi:ParB family chromosome partitioning protein
MGHTTQSDLDGVETALRFHLRDWWQPTAANFLGLLSKNQIVAALKEAGLSDAASDAEKMKKGDAASHAEQCLSATRWVPAWMRSPDAVQPDITDGDATDADTDEHSAHAA